MTLHAREWKRRSARTIKPGGCSLRRSKPRGPFKGCKDTCLAFEACVELAREEKAYDEWMVKERERLDRLDARGTQRMDPFMR